MSYELCYDLSRTQHEVGATGGRRGGSPAALWCRGSSAASCACAARKSFGSVRVVVRAAPAAGLQTADRFCRVGTKRSGGHKQERMKAVEV
ncbi:unnamed protein product [Gadus morhua 'NCC']